MKRPKCDFNKVRDAINSRNQYTRPGSEALAVPALEAENPLHKSIDADVQLTQVVDLDLSRCCSNDIISLERHCAAQTGRTIAASTVN